MNEVITISGVDCYEKDGTAYLKLEAVASRQRNRPYRRLRQIRQRVLWRRLSRIRDRAVRRRPRRIRCLRQSNEAAYTAGISIITRMGERNENNHNRNLPDIVLYF